MENRKYIEKLIEIEALIVSNINLLEITKTYCENNYDKSNEITAIGAIINIILDKQKLLIKALDGIS